MQNRFGLKDFVLLVLVIGVGLLVLLAIFAEDRRWNEVQKISTRTSELERNLVRLESKIGEEGLSTRLDRVDQALARLDTRLAQGVRVSGEAGASQTETEATPEPQSLPGADTSWARPGVDIQWQPPFAFKTDPRVMPGFQVGGEVTEVYEAQLPRVTPFISPDVYSRRIQEKVLGSLGVYDPVELEMRGMIAEAWQVDPEGLWLRARIRPNARFSDGTPVTAEDIRWTLHEFVMNEQIEAERTRSIYRDSIKVVNVIDPRTVEFEFHQRLFTNVDNALSMFILPKHIYEQFTPGEINRGTGLLVGAGPFRMKDFDPTRQWTPPADVVLERNEQFFGTRPPLAGVRLKSIQEEISRLNAFKKGEADIISASAPQFLAMKEDPNWKVKAQYLSWVNMRSGYSFIAWNCGERNGRLTPFHDRRVRLAMTHLLDREKMIRDIWSGIGVVAKGNMPLQSPGANKEIKPWPYDPQKGLDLLKQAGYEDRDGNGVLEDAAGNDLQFEFSYATGSEISEKIARFVLDSYTRAGIRVSLRGADWSVYQDFMKLRDFDAITLGWGASAPESDPRQIFHSDSIKNQGDNFAQWSNAEADRLIDEGRREMDTDERMAIWREFERVLHEEQPYTFIRVPPWLRIVSIDVHNVQPYPKGFEHWEFFRGGPASPAPAN